MSDLSSPNLSPTLPVSVHDVGTITEIRDSLPQVENRQLFIKRVAPIGLLAVRKLLEWPNASLYALHYKPVGSKVIGTGSYVAFTREGTFFPVYAPKETEEGRPYLFRKHAGKIIDLSNEFGVSLSDVSVAVFHTAVTHVHNSVKFPQENSFVQVNNNDSGEHVKFEFEGDITIDDTINNDDGVLARTGVIQYGFSPTSHAD